MRAASPENVSDLIAKPSEKYEPEPRYVSKYRDQIRKASKRGKSAHKTLGVPNVVLASPGQYLKKRSKSAPKRPQIHHEHYRRPGYQRKLPDWQPIKASNVENRTPENHVDFTKKNIDEAKNLRPTRVRKYYVDDKHGNAHPLKPSGLFPFYRNRKNNGQTPGDVSPTNENRSSGPRQRTIGGHSSRREDEKSKGQKHEERTRRRTASPRREDTKLREKKHEERTRRRTASPRREDKKLKEKKHEELRRQNTAMRASGSAHKEDKLKSGKKQQNSKVESRNLGDVRKSFSSDDKLESPSTTSTISTGVDQQPRCRYVTEDERSELLYGMKKKWDEMMKQFQCLPILTDTPPKAKRKSKMEKDLLQLEKDIEIIERHPYIYVYEE